MRVGWREEARRVQCRGNSSSSRASSVHSSVIRRDDYYDHDVMINIIIIIISISISKSQLGRFNHHGLE